MPEFTHPAALWALLGIPVVLAIHFLQRRSRKVKVTTLFLLQQMKRESEKGNRIERLRLSVPLWLQLLMVLLLAWLLAGPRWMRTDAVQRIALVMDSSASMQAFRPEAEDALRQTLASFVRPGTRTELALLSSDAGAASLYYGNSSADLLKALPGWQPLLGTHDFSPALRSARSLTGPQGAVLLITDHPLASDPPYDAKVLSIGQETANVGWVGMTVEEKDGQLLWRALVRNHSRTPQEREWRAETEGQASKPVKITLAPQETRTLSGPFPDDLAGGRLSLVLTADALPLDDRLPIVKPSPKILSLNLPAPKDESAKAITELLGKYADTAIEPEAAKADVRVIIWPPAVALEPNQHACVFASPSRAANPPALQGPIVAEAHPLMEGLNWQSILVREGMVVPKDSKDRILLWQGQRPVITLRETAAGAKQLFCHFDLETSNARKLPALAVLLHRFLEEIRREKVATQSANFDVRERLSVAHQRGSSAQPLTLRTQAGGTETIPLHQVHLLRAPAQPGFFEVIQGEKPLLSGASHFADSREADLTQAKPYDERSELKALQVESLQESDPDWRLWTLAVVAALLASWWWGRDKPNAAAASSSSNLNPRQA